jgi:hypothetical protein
MRHLKQKKCLLWRIDYANKSSNFRLNHHKKKKNVCKQAQSRSRFQPINGSEKGNCYLASVKNKEERLGQFITEKLGKAEKALGLAKIHLEANRKWFENSAQLQGCGVRETALG